MKKYRPPGGPGATPMGEFWDRLFDTAGFVPRRDCGDGWTPGLVWLHVGSDLALWLAYLSIPLVLLYSVRRRRDAPLPGLAVLIAGFVVAGGFTHFFDAIMFSAPLYRFAGVYRGAAAALGWATVFVLIQSIPRLNRFVAAAAPKPGTAAHRPLRAAGPGQARDYIIALLAAALAVLVRAALDPVLKGDNAFVLSLLAVVYVSWQCGFMPGVVTLFTSLTATIYFFVVPRESFVVANMSDQFAVAASVFCGVGCAALGHAQRESRKDAAESLAAALDQKAALEAEVAHRVAVERALRERETELGASEARFRGLAEAVPQIAWVTKADGSHEYFNPKWYEYTGQAEAESLGWGWANPLHPDDRARSEARWKLATGTGDPYEIEYRFRRHDGAYRWFLGRALPQRDEAGAIVRWFGTCTDIDDSKQLEERLRHAAERFQMLTEAVPQMVWTTDAAGKVTYFNRRWLEFTGVTVADSAGDGWLQAVHPDDAGKLRTVWNQALRQCDERFTQEFRIRTQPAGEYRWVLSTAVSLHHADGTVAEWVGTLTDIEDQKRQAETLERLVGSRTRDLEEANLTLHGLVEERRRAEEKVAGVARELQRSNGELEQFAYVASHDLQEPLRKIQAFGDLLRNKFAANLPENGQEYVGKMQGSAGRMSRLIDDLLAFSRVTTHARPFVRVDLDATLGDVVDDLEVRIEKTGAAVEVGPLQTIDGDPSQIRQLFQNLIGNALKFVRPGIPPVIRVIGVSGDESSPSGDRVETFRITVADNGIGFDEKYLSRIFQVFQRLHGREEYDGTGVGLAICKKIVDRHNGAITARSRPGEGAVFSVSLPVRQVDPSAAKDGMIVTPAPA